MSKPIDLGRKWDDIIGIVQAGEDKDRTHYPDLHIGETADARLLDLPDEGEATIRFKVVHRNHSEHTGAGGKKERRCSLTLEVLSIDPPDKAKKKKNGDWGGNGARQSFRDYIKDK